MKRTPTQTKHCTRNQQQQHHPPAFRPICSLLVFIVLPLSVCLVSVLFPVCLVSVPFLSGVCPFFPVWCPFSCLSGDCLFPCLVSVLFLSGVCPFSCLSGDCFFSLSVWCLSFFCLVSVLFFLPGVLFPVCLVTVFFTVYLLSVLFLVWCLYFFSLCLVSFFLSVW